MCPVRVNSSPAFRCSGSRSWRRPSCLPPSSRLGPPVWGRRAALLFPPPPFPPPADHPLHCWGTDATLHCLGDCSGPVLRPSSPLLLIPLKERNSPHKEIILVSCLKASVAPPWPLARKPTEAAVPGFLRALAAPFATLGCSLVSRLPQGLACRSQCPGARAPRCLAHSQLLTHTSRRLPGQPYA